MEEHDNKMIPIRFDVGGGRPLAGIGSKVWNAETGEHVVVTQELLQTYMNAMQLVHTGRLAFAIGLQNIFATRAYVADGFHSFREFVDEKIGMSLRQARRYVRMGEARFLMLNTMENRGMDAEKIRQIDKALAEQPDKYQSVILSMPEDEAVDAIENTWIAPDGRDLAPHEVLEVIGKDQADKLRRVKADRDDMKTQLETLTAELEELRKIASGDTTVALEATKKLEKLQAKYDAIAGLREQGERAAQELTKAKLQIAQGIDTLHKYIVRGEEDLDSHPEECGLAAGIAGELLPRLERIADNYARFRAAMQS